MSYEETLRLANENRYYKHPSGQRGDWLRVLQACCEAAQRTNGEFPGSIIADKVGWFPSLQIFKRYGILRVTGRSRRGQRAYYRFQDIEGTKRALRELGFSI